MYKPQIYKLTPWTQTDGYIFVFAEFVSGQDTDRAHPYVEDCIAKEEPINKVCGIVMFSYASDDDCVNFIKWN